MIDNFTWTGGEEVCTKESLSGDNFVEEREIEVPDLTNEELNVVPTYEEATAPKKVEYPLVLLQASNATYIETIKETILNNRNDNNPIIKGVEVSYISTNKDGGTGVVFYKGLFNIYIYNKIRRYGVEVSYYPRKGEKVLLKDKEFLLKNYKELFDEARYC